MTDFKNNMKSKVLKKEKTKDLKKLSKKKDKLNIIDKVILKKQPSKNKLKKKLKTETLPENITLKSETVKKVSKNHKENLSLVENGNDNSKTLSDTTLIPKNQNKSKKKILNCSSNWKILEQELKRDNEKNKKESHKRKLHYTNNDFSKNAKKSKFNKDVWFDNVDVHDLLSAESEEPMQIVKKGKSKKIPLNENAKTLVKTNAFGGLTKVVAMDCEMVGVGEEGRNSVLARVSLVNQFGKCIYDKYVKSREEVTDYRTFVSGIRPQDLVDAPDFEVVQKEVADILQGRILVGHALWNDFKVLFLDHPKRCIRDTAKYIPFKTMTAGRSPALRVLCAKILGVQVQKGEHSSVQDAQAAMRLYVMHKKQWEAEKTTPKLSKKAKKNLSTDKVLAKSSSTS